MLADPELGPLDAVLDGTALAALLPDVERCVPRYAGYRPGRQPLVLYELDGALGHLTMLHRRRAERLWARAANLKGQTLYVRALSSVLQMYPVDVRLPGLREASAGAELVRYKPGRRALLRFRRDGRTVYGKVRADGSDRTALGRALIERGIATPVPLAHVPRLGMTVHAEAPGTRLAELRDGALEDWMEPVAAALARLHRTELPGPPAHSMEDEIDDLRAAAATADALLPDAGAGPLAERLIAGLAAVPPRRTTIHGSFHDDQVLVGDAGVVLLDLDSAAAGPPLLDAGHFAAYMTAAGRERARARFLDAYGAGPEVMLFEAAALVRWSSLPFRRLEPDWPAAVARRLDLAGARLAAYDTG